MSIPSAFEGQRRVGTSKNKLSNARTPKVCKGTKGIHCPQKLESGYGTQAFRMTFIQLLAYLHFGKFPFAA